jgi:transposase-like protein
MTSASTNLYKRHRFPGEIISHAVWLYFRFPLSHRDLARNAHKMPDVGRDHRYEDGCLKVE